MKELVPQSVINETANGYRLLEEQQAFRAGVALATSIFNEKKETRSIVSLNADDFEHMGKESFYNNNFFKMKNTQPGYSGVILEKCDDDGDCEFYLIENGERVFLGCSKQSLTSSQIVKIDFKFFYT